MDEENYVTVHWENGTDFIFDDNNFHEVHNAVNASRVVLFAAVPRSDLSLMHNIIHKVVIWAGNLVGALGRECSSAYFQNLFFGSTCNWFFGFQK